MKTTKNLFIVFSLIFLFILGLSGFGVSTLFASNENAVKPGEFIVEPPTLISLGFEWYIEGDANRNATVEVWYSKKEGDFWKEALPLLRLNGEQSVIWNSIVHPGGITTPPLVYVAPNMFAGSIFDLEPDTEYEVMFVMSDPDGVIGKPYEIVTVRTRPEPKPFEGGNIYHLYPPGYTGPKETPNFPTLMSTYYVDSVGGDWNNVWPPRVQPGDTILVHAGLYKIDRYRFNVNAINPFDGTYYLTVSGTPEKPIVIKAAGDGEVIFDGDGCYNLFNVQGADYNYFEGLTIRNTDVAFSAGNKNITGSSGLTVKKCRFENIGIAVFTDWSGSKNFYIADNVMLGRMNQDGIMGWSGLPWNKLPGYPPRLTSYYAVKVYGSGHIICHNYVAGFLDGIDHATYGLPDGYPAVIRDRMPVSIDIYNNDITSVSDNCIETDGAMHNIRVLRNRCLNISMNVLSAQPMFGGPVYFIRNIVYNAPGAGTGVWKPVSQAQGVVAYHNTVCDEAVYKTISNSYFLNNLFLGQGKSGQSGPNPQLYVMDTFTNYTTSDYNGFRPNPGVDYPFVWQSPPFDVPVDYVNPRVVRQFKTLSEYSQATGQDEHSRLVDYDIFQNVAQADLNDPQRIYKAEELNFQLKPNAVAVDAGCILPNVNDDFTGNAPDLGALEVGQPMPIYGPRP